MTSASKPTPAERIRRGSPVAQPTAGRTVSGDVRIKPVRVTVDLDPAAYDALRDWAHHARLSHADVLRRLLHLLADQDVATKVRSVTQ
jgi:hypothetical protein